VPHRQWRGSAASADFAERTGATPVCCGAQTTNGTVPPPEDALAQAERHVREAEAHLAHLVAIIEEVDRDDHPKAADRAKKGLATLRHSLELPRDRLRIEREARGLEP
jgi:hypothetical protein